MSCCAPSAPGRLFSHTLVENDLGGCADCGQPATKLLVGGAGQPDTNLCEPCEYRRYLAVMAATTTLTSSAPAGARAIVGG
jgi:hypothetical protein